MRKLSNRLIEWAKAMPELTNNKLLSVIISNGIHKFVTPKGYELMHLTKTTITQNVNEQCNGFALAEFEGLHWPGFKKPSPYIKGARLYAPSGEPIEVTDGITIVNQDEGLTTYRVKTLVRLKYETNHK